MLAVLALSQQLFGYDHPLRILIFTLGAMSSDVAHGGTWGLARTLRIEHQRLRAQSNDVKHGPSMASAQWLRLSREPEVAWYPGMRFVARLRASADYSMRNTALARGLYAITGGLCKLQNGLQAFFLSLARHSYCLVYLLAM